MTPRARWLALLAVIVVLAGGVALISLPDRAPQLYHWLRQMFPWHS